MSLHGTTNGARLGIEHLEDRCTPSAWLGNHPVLTHGQHEKPPAAHFASHNSHRAAPITMSTHISSDGSNALTLSGVGTFLGHFTGDGVIEHFKQIGNKIMADGTFTIRAANGDQLFGTFSISLNLKEERGSETVLFTGGTGRFAGVTGKVSQTCETTFDPVTHAFECNATGTGSLNFNHSQCEGKHEKIPDDKHEKTPDVKHPKTPDVNHPKTPDVEASKVGRCTRKPDLIEIGKRPMGPSAK